MNLIKKMHRMSPLLLLLTLTVFPGNAWAVQSHGAPEGLYVHQLAHIFYTCAMCYLFWDVRRSEFKSKGWRFLQIFCVFIVLWNIVAFTGHSLSSHLDASEFTHEGGYLTTRLQGPFDTVKILFYFAKLDHLFSVPALYFLYRAMKSLYEKSCEEEV